MAPIKKVMLEELFSSVHIEDYAVLSIPPNVISEEADAIETAQKLRIKVDLIDKLSGQICKKQEHFEVLQHAQIWKTQLS